MTAENCPFCGVATDVRHETQKACIDALQNEIVRTRRILEQVTDPRHTKPVAEKEEDRQLT